MIPTVVKGGKLIIKSKKFALPDKVEVGETMADVDRLYNPHCH